MTKDQFKRKWNTNKITYDDIADCAKAWGLYHDNPKIHDINEVTEVVVHAAGCKFDDE